jgi:hypothetical protein
VLLVSSYAASVHVTYRKLPAGVEGVFKPAWANQSLLELTSVPTLATSPDRFYLAPRQQGESKLNRV